MIVHIMVDGVEKYATELEMDNIILDSRFTGVELEVLEYIEEGE